jgi:hypothetical protein
MDLAGAEKSGNPGAAAGSIKKDDLSCFSIILSK